MLVSLPPPSSHPCCHASVAPPPTARTVAPPAITARREMRGGARPAGSGGGASPASLARTTSQQHLIARVLQVSLPPLERDRLKLAESERWFDGVDADRNIGAPPQRPRSFVPHEPPVRSNRPFAPRYDDAMRPVEMALDLFAPVRAAADMRVPPHRAAIGFERAATRDLSLALSSAL